MRLIQWLGRRLRAEAGFTLIELVITVAIVGVIAVSLTGIVLVYLKTTISTSARLTESNSMQFVTAYWQRDVASLGVRSTDFPSPATDTVHSPSLLQSVAAPDTGTPSLATCALPSGTPVVTLAWSSYGADPATPATVTITYVAQATGTVFDLLRVRCTGATKDSQVKVAGNLDSAPTVACYTTAGYRAVPPTTTDCAAAAVPDIVTLTLVTVDPDNADGSTYTATLTGERRET